MPLAPEEPPSRRDFELLYRSVEKLTRTLEELPDKMAATYVRLDTYQRDQIIHEHTHGEHEKDIGSLQDVVKWVVGFVFAGVGGGLLAVVLK